MFKSFSLIALIGAVSARSEPRGYGYDNIGGYGGYGIQGTRAIGGYGGYGGYGYDTPVVHDAKKIDESKSVKQVNLLPKLDEHDDLHNRGYGGAYGLESQNIRVSKDTKGQLNDGEGYVGIGYGGYGDNKLGYGYGQVDEETYGDAKDLNNGKISKSRGTGLYDDEVVYGHGLGYGGYGAYGKVVDREIFSGKGSGLNDNDRNMNLGYGASVGPKQQGLYDNDGYRGYGYGHGYGYGDEEIKDTQKGVTGTGLNDSPYAEGPARGQKDVVAEKDDKRLDLGAPEGRYQAGKFGVGKTADLGGDLYDQEGYYGHGHGYGGYGGYGDIGYGYDSEAYGDAKDLKPKNDKSRGTGLYDDDLDHGYGYGDRNREIFASKGTGLNDDGDYGYGHGYGLGGYGDYGYGRDARVEKIVVKGKDVQDDKNDDRVLGGYGEARIGYGINRSGYGYGRNDGYGTNGLFDGHKGLNSGLAIDGHNKNGLYGIQKHGLGYRGNKTGAIHDGSAYGSGYETFGKVNQIEDFGRNRSYGQGFGERAAYGNGLDNGYGADYGFGYGGVQSNVGANYGVRSSIGKKDYGYGLGYGRDLDYGYGRDLDYGYGYDDLDYGYGGYGGYGAY